MEICTQQGRNGEIFPDINENQHNLLGQIIFRVQSVNNNPLDLFLTTNPEFKFEVRFHFISSKILFVD